MEHFITLIIKIVEVTMNDKVKSTRFWATWFVLLLAVILFGGGFAAIAVSKILAL